MTRSNLLRSKLGRSMMPRVLTMIFSLLPALAHAKIDAKANDLVQFLEGRWQDVGFDISDSTPVRREEYPEAMVIKDSDTLTITAYGIRDGKDLTKDMRLEVRGESVTLRQGGFVARGTREGNAYHLKGTEGGKEYRLHLFTIGDKYVFQREIWTQGKVQEVDMSYLVRQQMP